METNNEELREYCLSLPQVQEISPWTKPRYKNLITFTIGGKWFCLFDPDKKFIDVKCSPDTIQEMLCHYKGAFPAWHMNKEHWLGITLESDIPDIKIQELIEEGYNLVVKNLPKSKRP